MVISTLLPESKPLDLQMAPAAATQSGAPLGAIVHFSCPITTRAPGMRVTAPAASRAPSTVDLAAMPASWLRFSTPERAPRKPEPTQDHCSSNQCVTLPNSPRPSGATRVSDRSCAKASATLHRIAPAPTQTNSKEAALRPLQD